MGEGRTERSSKRQISSYGIDKSSSDTELAQGKGRKGKTKERWPILEGLTVDELARYRRRRVQGQPKDSLGPCPESGGKDHVSEYRRAFRASSEDLLKESIWPVRSKRPEECLEIKSLVEDQPSNREEPKESENVELPTRDEETTIVSLAVADGDKAMETETENARFIAHANPPGRPSLIRRGTNLKRRSEFHTDTETCSSYVAYEGQHRPELARRPTSLKMEGELETMTEKCEKFIQWLNVSRPELIRIPTHLKLEGELETSTENQEKYVPFVGARRPELLRQSTNLKLEGESSFMPEYTDVFRKHKVMERPLPMKPVTHLKTGTDLFQSTGMLDNFVNPCVKEMQLMAELNRDIEEEEERRRKEKEDEERKEEEMRMLVSKLENLKGPPLGVPEYKDAYKDFPRERPKIVKPEDEIGRADGSKVPSSPTHSKFSTKIDQDPEYKSKYLEYQRDRPVYRKPPLNTRPTLFSSGRSSAGYGQAICYDPKRSEFEGTSEVRSQYIPYGHIPKVETLKMPANLRLEGNLDLEPEYRTAYCTKRDYQACNVPRMHRKRDRSLSDSRRNGNYWMNNNNAEQFGRINAAEDQDAFQILSTRVHEESVVGKPPPGSRRGSKSSQTHVQKPTQSDVAERKAAKDRSPSPTYRLHVCNVDDEPRGFGQRRRSPSFQSCGRIRSPSPNRAIEDNTIRPYSPSFGRNAKQHADGQSFVVLDNALEDLNKNENRRRRMDRNYNIDSTVPGSRGRPRTPTNWMPPWYDSTNTI